MSVVTVREEDGHGKTVAIDVVNRRKNHLK
jgi:hypothetical protein